MKSFRQFISEISVNSEFPTLGIKKIPRQGKAMIPQEDDPKKDIIPIAIHHKFFHTISELRRELSASGVHSGAVRLFLKIEDQMSSAQKSMVLVMASNEEVHDLKELAESLERRSSPESQEYKTALYLRKTIENGIGVASQRSQNEI